MAVNYQKKLSHLTSEEIDDLMTLYYEGEKNSLLIEEYNIDIQSSLLVKTFPFKVYTDVLCKFCNIPLLSYQPSKSSYSSPDKFCQECGHKNNSFRCSCSGCEIEREQKKQNKEADKKIIENKTRDIILKTYFSNKEDLIDIDSFDLKTYLYICSLLRSCLSENLELIEPLINSKLKLAPTGKYRRSIISVLRSKNIILFSPTTNIDSVVIDDDEISEYYPENVTFEINIINSEYSDIVNSLLYLKNEFEISSEERINLWKEIAINECLEFLYARLDEYNLPSDNIGDKTESSIKSALAEFSISQLYNFIWRAVKNAAAFYQKEHISKKHAVNTIAGNISRSSERAIVEGWDIKNYGRDYNYPQTVISEVFFNIILKIGEKGFNTVIA